MRLSSLFQGWFDGRGVDVDGQGLETALEHTWPVPAWATLLGILAALAIVLAVYHYERRGAKPIRALMAVMRIGVLGLALFMLFGWVQQQHRTELPELVVVVDVSQSMSFTDAYHDMRLRRAVQELVDVEGDGVTRLKLADSLLNGERRGWMSRLGESYRIKLYQFGTAARRMEIEGGSEMLLQASDEASRLGEGLLEIVRAQRGHATAAVVLLTDGVNTAGPTVLQAAEYARANSIPFHIVGLGSERPPSDLRINDLLVEDVVFAGDLLSFDFQLRSHGFAGRQATVRLTRADDERVLAEMSLTLPADGEILPVRLAYRPGEEGEFEHVVEVTPFDEEVTADNNRLSRVITVRNATVRVLLVQAAPSYEYRALKNLLSRATNGEAGQGRAVDLTVVLQESDIEQAVADSFPLRREELFSYDVLIIGDADPSFFTQSSLSNIAEFVTERGGGVIAFAGPRFMPHAYRDTPLAALLPFDAATTQLPSNESLTGDGVSLRRTAMGKEVGFLQLDDAPNHTSDAWDKLSRLRWFLETPDFKPAAIVLAEHPTRRLLDGRPLPVISMQFVGAGKVMFQASDETYLWSRHQGSNQHYSRYWMQAIRYFSHVKLDADRRPVELSTDSPQYLQGEGVSLHVRFRDDRLAPTGDEDVTLTLEDDQGKRTSLTLARRAATRGDFYAELTDLDVGSFQVSLTTPVIEQTPAAIQFAVTSSNSEQAVLQMNAAGLKEAARISGGRFHTIDTADRLAATLPRGTQVRIEPLPPRPIWNSPWIAALFVALLATEWTLRKRVGLL